MVRDQAKVLLVTADDLGLCASVTDGIFAAHRHGIVRATSLFVVGEDAERAAARARQEAGLKVGIHLALIDGSPCAPRAEVSSLVDENGLFPDNYVDFVRRYLKRHIRISEVYREWRAQIQQALAWGIRPMHLDSHQHLHLLPGLFDQAVRLCEEFTIPRLRVPLADFPSSGSAWRSYLSPGTSALQLLSWRASRALAQRSSVRMCRRFLGREQSCKLSQKALLMLIDSVEEGTQELMCHPGQSDSVALQRYAFGVNWGRELEALTSPEVRARIAERGIVLVGAL